MKKLLTATALMAMMATGAQAKEINLECHYVEEGKNNTELVMINTNTAKGSTKYNQANISSDANTYMVKSLFYYSKSLLVYQIDINRADLTYYSTLKIPAAKSLGAGKELITENKGTCTVIDISKNKI